MRHHAAEFVSFSFEKLLLHNTAVTGIDVNILSETDMTTFIRQKAKSRQWISDPSAGDMCSDKGRQKEYLWI